jgi:hypothetical protein
MLEVAASRRTGFSSPPLAAAIRGGRGWLRFFEGAGEDLVNQCQCHSSVGGSISMDRAPSGVGRQDLAGAGPVLGGEEVARRNDLAGRVGAESAFNKLVKPDQVEEELQSGVRYQPMGAVASFATAGDVCEAEKGGDDEDPSVATHSQDPFQVRDGRRHSRLSYTTFQFILA